MDFPEADDPLEQIAEKVVKNAVRSSPWLALSLLFHGGVLSTLPLVIFCEQLRLPETHPITISVDAARIDPDRNYKPVSGGPPSFEGTGLDEPPIYFPNAVTAERNESADRRDDAQISGESLAASSHIGDEGLPGTFRGRLMGGPPGTNDIMGVGGGSGAGGFRFGGKVGGRKNLVARGGGSSATEAAVEAGLAWLARHQLPDGHWASQVDMHRCGTCSGASELDGCDLGVTALGALAFIGAGYGPGCGEGRARDPRTGRVLHYGDAVRAALRWLERHQDDDGRFQGKWDQGHQLAPMYNQAFGTLAFCEAYRATKSDAFRGPAERALTWLQNARNYTSGWRYVPGANEPDISITGACVQALRSAQLSGLAVTEKTRAGVASFLAKVTDSSGIAGYIVEGGRMRRLGAACPAIGIYVGRFTGAKRDEALYENAARTVQKNVLSKTGYQHQWDFVSDFYCWYYAMLAFFDAEGPRGTHFKAVNDFVTKKLCALQERAGCAAGSWDSKDDLYMRYGGGRACATALNVLTLEVYYRYATDEPGAATPATPSTTGPSTTAEPR